MLEENEGRNWLWLFWGGEGGIIQDADLVQLPVWLAKLSCAFTYLACDIKQIPSVMQ